MPSSTATASPHEVLLDISLRIVFRKEGRNWIAHCLEFDLFGDGRTKEKALQELTAAIGLQLDESRKHRNWHNLFSPAPGKAWEMFALGRDTPVGNLAACIDELTAGRSEPFRFGDIRLRAYASDNLTFVGHCD